MARYKATGHIPPTWKRPRAFKAYIEAHPPTVAVDYRNERTNPYRNDLKAIERQASDENSNSPKVLSV